jgi:long-subunit acyl-CoA synthetase (AMP-forming)
VRPGDFVGIHSWNRAEWIETMIGVHKARAVPININYRYVEAELRYLFDNAELVAAYPLGPVMEGCGLNITVFSYRDSVDIGFMACREQIPDVWALAQATDTAFAELSDAAEAEQRHHDRASGRTARKSLALVPDVRSPAKKRSTKKPRTKKSAAKSPT